MARKAQCTSQGTIRHTDLVSDISSGRKVRESRRMNYVSVFRATEAGRVSGVWYCTGCTKICRVQPAVGSMDTRKMEPRRLCLKVWYRRSKVVLIASACCLLPDESLNDQGRKEMESGMQEYCGGIQVCTMHSLPVS